MRSEWKKLCWYNLPVFRKKSGRNEADVPGTTLSKTMQNQLFSAMSNLTNSSIPKIHHQHLRPIEMTKTEFPRPAGKPSNACGGEKKTSRFTVPNQMKGDFRFLGSSRYHSAV